MSASLCNGRLAALARAPEGAAEVPTGEADGEAYNPVCGDEVRVRLAWGDAGGLRMEHATRGCAVCRASAGLAAGAVAGKTREEALALAGTFEECLAEGDFGRMGGEFGVFDGIGAYPARVHCARLPWTALRKALEQCTMQNAECTLEKDGGDDGGLREGQGAGVRRRAVEPAAW